MSVTKLLVLILSFCALSGCATRGALNIDCENFKSFVEDVKPSQLVRDIQSDTQHGIVIMSVDTASNPEIVSSPLVKTFENLSLTNAHLLALRPTGTPARQKGVLLLSGGGQWGAFGAGFLNELQTSTRPHPVDFQVVTGVSTGGLQSLFIAIDTVDPAAYKKLLVSYSPLNEKAVVNRNAKPLAILTGSLAGLKPLRRKIEEALCTRGNASNGCPMIDALARSGRIVYIGFVQASDGKFKYADAVRIAQSGSGAASVKQRKNAQQCLTGIALASAAMPVFFQQVRINQQAYYDGGVRQSVFEQNIAESLAVAEKLAQARVAQSGIRGASWIVTAPDLYVIRNGPTELLGEEGKPEADFKVDGSAGALTAAFRAEAIVVNQLEVGSIAALRLAHPTGKIHLVTADGYHKPFLLAGSPQDACRKPKDIMFDRAFMLCLQKLGASKAQRDEPWKELATLGTANPPVAATASSGP